jgi:hypothetical protein
MIRIEVFELDRKVAWNVVLCESWTIRAVWTLEVVKEDLD